MGEYSIPKRVKCAQLLSFLPSISSCRASEEIGSVLGNLNAKVLLDDHSGGVAT